MIGKIALGLFLFIMGVVLSIVLESFLGNLVRNLYVWTTKGGIQLVGKNFYLFADLVYYVGFGISLSLVALEKRLLLKNTLRRLVIWLIIFMTSVIVICAVDAHLKLIECTACNDGIRKLPYSAINYGLILGVSALVGGIPSMVRLTKDVLRSIKYRFG